MQHFDILIIGGGLVGGTLAASLSRLDLTVGLVENAAPQGKEHASFDAKSIALSESSHRIFKTLDLWPEMQMAAEPIREIHVSDRGHFGFTHIKAEKEKVSALGYVVEAWKIGEAIWQSLQMQDNLTLMCPAHLKALTPLEEGYSATIVKGDAEDIVSAKLLVAADGGRSFCRTLLNIDAHEKDYEQVAVIANLVSDQYQQGKAFERFTAEGPIALLPMTQGRYSLVWTVSKGKEARLLSLPPDTFLAELQHAFGHRVGRFTHVGARIAFPLKLLQTQQSYDKNLVFVGNAMQSLHPVAGQGLNLALRDVAHLAETIAQGFSDSSATVSGLLQSFAEQRHRDRQETIGLTDTLVKTFCRDQASYQLARNIGLVATDFLPPLKRFLANRCMGIKSPLPKLACGIPIDG